MTSISRVVRLREVGEADCTKRDILLLINRFNITTRGEGLREVRVNISGKFV